MNVTLLFKDDIRDHFAEFGTIRNCILSVDHRTGYVKVCRMPSEHIHSLVA